MTEVIFACRDFIIVFLVLLRELLDLFVQRQVKYMYSYLNINVFTRIAIEFCTLFSQLHNVTVFLTLQT